MEKNIKSLQNKINILEKELKYHKLLYSKFDKMYDTIKKEALSNNKKAKYRKDWIDNNWNSITSTFVDQILDMADNSFNLFENNQKKKK
jgi:hypothetical protein